LAVFEVLLTLLRSLLPHIVVDLYMHEVVVLILCYHMLYSYSSIVQVYTITTSL